MVSIYGAMTAQRKARIWQLWQRGVPMSIIARDIAKPPATVYSYLLYHGGMTPRQRTRRAGCLSMSERESISRGVGKWYKPSSHRSRIGTLGVDNFKRSKPQRGIREIPGM